VNITPLRQDLIPQVIALMEQGAPYVRARTYSDYWLYGTLFSSSCPVAVIEGEVAGAVMAFRSQDAPVDVYIQDVMTSPQYRRQGVAKALIDWVREQAGRWGCVRLYLTSEPDNTPAQRAWLSMGFFNVPGDQVINGVSVITNYKGPGKDRAVYQLDL
jgi:GNAT superfamily N-acetyltransferase